MPSILLKTNLANRNIFIQNTLVNIETNNVAEVKITPKNGWKINSNDFSAGRLPLGIISIKFSNSGKNVIATVTLDKSTSSQGESIIYLPISSLAKSLNHRVAITESIEKDNNIITRFSSPLSTSIINGKITYELQGRPNEKKLLFKRTFILVGDYEFVNIPKYNIGNNSNRFSVDYKPLKRDKKILGYEFKVYYTSPKKVLDPQDFETIDFKAASYLKKVTKPMATKKEEYKIYSFDRGRKIGAQGGFRNLKVTGVPGTTFKLLLQDSNKNTYNAKTGVYEAGGGMIQAVIPKAIGGLGYGVWNKRIKVPRATTVISYSERLIDDLPIDHSKITSTIAANQIASYKQDILQETTIGPESIIKIGANVSVLSGGIFATAFMIGGDNAVFGPGDLGTTIDGGNTIRFKVFPPAGSSITVSRQPLNDLTKPYVAWDSGDKADADTSAGVAIENDWYNSSVLKGSLETSRVVLGCNCETGSDSRSVSCTLTVNSITFGEEDTIYQLSLNNFLTLTSL